MQKKINYRLIDPEIIIPEKLIDTKTIIFIGENGSEKSTIIDTITYLYLNVEQNSDFHYTHSPPPKN